MLKIFIIYNNLKKLKHCKKYKKLISEIKKNIYIFKKKNKSKYKKKKNENCEKKNL